jgi:predicted esterase
LVRITSRPVLYKEVILGVINPFVRPSYPVIVASCFSPVPIPLAAPVFWNFWKNGFNAELVWTRLADMRDVRTFSVHLRDVVIDTLKKYGSSRVNLTGFSMGGVASLYAVKRLGIIERVASLISVAAPFHGSPFGYLGTPTCVYSKSGRQMQPGSRFLVNLHADPLPTGPRFVTISGSKDRICPMPTAMLEGAKNIVLATGHLNTLIDAEVHALVASFFV